MTSASYPVGSTPAPNQQSFLVHLNLLTDISRELQTQVEGIAKPVDTVLDLLTAPPALGQFTEASTLTSWSQEAAAQMQGLLGDVRSAMQFADEVTRTVATGYARADDDVAWGMVGSAVGGSPVGAVVGIATGTVGAATGAVGGITAGLTHTVGGVVDGVGATVAGVTHGLTDGVGPTVQGLTQGVDHTVGAATGSILGALTGGAPRHAAPDDGGVL